MAFLASLAGIGSSLGAASAGAVGAGGLAAGAGAAGAGAAGLGAVGAGGLAAATPVITSAASGTLSMAPALQSLPALGSSMPTSGLMGSSMVGSPMNFSGVAGQMSVPGAPGHVGGTPMPHSAGSQTGSGMMGQKPQGTPQDTPQPSQKGSGAPISFGPQLKPPTLTPGNFSAFQPFQFSRNNYQFRRPIGF